MNKKTLSQEELAERNAKAIYRPTETAALEHAAAIYVDEVRRYGAKGKWCHLWTDGSDRHLDHFARKMGLKAACVSTSQCNRGYFYHYHLRPATRDLAIKLGAIEMSLSNWISNRR